MGGERLLPDPDPIARDYLLLALRLGQHIEGIVDGYFGPADLKAQVDMEQKRMPARLADDAVALRARVGAEAGSADRRDWLDRQLIALETQARALAGDSLPYLVHVERCFDLRPTRRPDDEFRALADRLDALVPGAGQSRSGSPSSTKGSRSRSTACRQSRMGSSTGSGLGLPGISGCPRANGSSSGSSATSPGAATTGTRAAVSRGSISTPTCRCARRICCTCSPTRLTPATTSSTRGRRPTWSLRRAGSRPRSC